MQSIDIATAREFFLQLEKFSRRVRLEAFKKESISPWGHEAYATPQPKGCIIHYTASHDIKSTAKWFCDPLEKSNASAHVIIGRDYPAWAAEIAKHFTLIAALPTLVIQCRLPQQTAWHATWTNDTCYGIELMNCGEVRGEKGHYTWWPDNFQAPYPSTSEPIVAFGKKWQGWPKEQLLTCAMVAMYANAYFGRSFEPHMILGHENVQGLKTVHGGGHDKRDPGPLFPMASMRHAIRQGDLTALAFKDATVYDTQARVSDVSRMVTKTVLVDDARAADKFWEQVADLPNAANRVGLSIGIMAVLGYAVDLSASILPGNINAESLAVFQRLMGLGHDGILGPHTVDALRERAFDRFGRTLNAKPRNLT